MYVEMYIGFIGISGLIGTVVERGRESKDVPIFFVKM